MSNPTILTVRANGNGGFDLVPCTEPEDRPRLVHEHDYKALEAENAQLRAERDRLMSCVRWFLGVEGNFPPRRQGDPPYWFRTAFREEFPVEHDAALTQREGGEND